MGTSSTITSVTPDGKYKNIYCNFDGYIDHNGKVLYRYYNTQEKIDKLLNLGDISSLDKNCKTSVAYIRDRGETDVEAKIYDTYDEVPKQDYNYLWNGKQWLVSNSELNKKPLKQMLAREKLKNL